MAAYGLWRRCVSEGFASMTFVFFALTLLANKLLPKTKGHDMSYGWLAFGVGLAVFIPVQFMGHISTSLNPAMALGSAIVGDLDWKDWPWIAMSELLGAFVGSVLMWVYYYPQFHTDPEPPPKRDAERLLRTRDDIGRRGLDYVSYNTQEPTTAVPRPLQGLRQRLHQTVRRTSQGGICYHTSDVLGPEASRARTNRRKSVTIADLHHRLEGMEVKSQLSQELRTYSETEKKNGSDGKDSEICVDMGVRLPEEEIEEDKHSDPDCGTTHSLARRFSDSAKAIAEMDIRHESKEPTDLISNEIRVPLSSVEENHALSPNGDALISASRVADRNMKLALFCTRPTTYHPLINLLTEAIATFFLVIGILFIKERSEFMYDGYEDVYRHGIMAFYIGLLISLLVLSLGGMGVAMNPARDLAPRFAHWLLPIDGKGVSEWYYAWIPIVGPFLGSTVAGYTFLALKELNKAGKEGGMYDAEFNSVLSSLNTN